jgi:hypothetical protein
MDKGSGLRWLFIFGPFVHCFLNKFIVLVFLAYWTLKRRPHWTSRDAFGQINTLRISTSHARRAANKHRQVSSKEIPGKKEANHHGNPTDHRWVDGEASPLSQRET